MTDKPPYSPEQTALSAPEASAAVLENRIDSAAPPAGQAIEPAQTSEQTAMQQELGRASYAPVVEAQARVDAAEPPEAAVKQLEPAQEIAVKGFENSGVMSNQEVQQYLKDTLPPEHLSGAKITEINYPNQYNGDERGVTLGVCKTDQQTNVSQIDIYAQTPQGSFDRNEMEHTLTHEVGHNVYYNMTPEKQQQWNALSSGSQPGEYVTEYAQSSVREDFAESYSHYARDPEALKDASMAKYNFMRDLVFHGRQYAA